MPSRADLTTRPNRGRRERPDDARHRQRPAERTTPQTRDGRRERTEVTRRRILDATRELILSGSFDPTAQAVAARAGITTRTLFRHFADMRTLHREIILDAQRYAHAVMDEPFPGEPGSENRWPALLQAVIERRVRIYEYLFPLHISAIYQRYRSNRDRTGHQPGCAAAAQAPEGDFAAPIGSRTPAVRVTRRHPEHRVLGQPATGPAAHCRAGNAGSALRGRAPGGARNGVLNGCARGPYSAAAAIRVSWMCADPAGRRWARAVPLNIVRRSNRNDIH